MSAFCLNHHDKVEPTMMVEKVDGVNIFFINPDIF